MASEPSRQLVPAFPPEGFLRSWHLAVDGMLRTGRLEATAGLAARSAVLAEQFGDLVTAINVRLLGSLARLGLGDPVAAEAEARAGLALIEQLAPPDPTVSAVISHGGGSLPPDALPRHARFWRAEALALLARAAVTQGGVAPAMDLLADAMAGIENTEPQTVDDAAACLVLANGLSSVALLEPSAALAARALAVTDRLAVHAPSDLVLGIRTTLARRLAEATALLAAYASLAPTSDSTAPHFAAAASTALRHRRLAENSRDTRELDVARIFLAYAEQALRGPTPDGLLELAEEAAVQGVLDRLDKTVVVGPGRGGGPLGRIVLARLRSLRGDLPAARVVLAEGEQAHPPAEQAISLWFGLVAVTQAQVEDQEDDPAVALWRELALTVGTRQWRERDARFDDLRHRIAQRQLRWRRAATEGELLRDPLTGLGNRRRLEVELDREISSVMFLDMDRFKQINDVCGHEVGDVVLRRVGNILRACCRAPDIVIRYGGDEFVVILDRGSDARALGERVIERVRAEDWRELTGEIPVTVSIGAAAAPTLRDALRQSDTAMLAAKQAGRDGLILRPAPAGTGGDGADRLLNGTLLSGPLLNGPLNPAPDGGSDGGALRAQGGDDPGPGGAPGDDRVPAPVLERLAAGSLRVVAGGSASSRILVRPDDVGGLMPLLRDATATFHSGDWSAADTALAAVIATARQLGDRATLRDAQLQQLRVLEHRAIWPRLLEAARDFLQDDELPQAARAAGLGMLASAQLHDGRIDEALSAIAEGYEIVTQVQGWATHRVLACLTLSAPMCNALLFGPALELLALGERLSTARPIQPWTVLTPSRLAWHRARAEVLRGHFADLVGDRAAADRHFGTAAAHALRCRGAAEPGSLQELRAEAIFAVALERLTPQRPDVDRLGADRAGADRPGADRFGAEQVDRELLARHVAQEPFPRVSLLSRLSLAPLDARAGDLAAARARVDSVLADAPGSGDLVLEYVATAWAARLAETPGGSRLATSRWQRVAERQLSRLWTDRVSRFEALLAARQTEALSEAVETERRRLWEDPLTAVGNRRLLDRLLADPVMAARPTAFIDVDWFKQINDRFGHAVGDEVLHRVAAQLVAASRAGDVVVRYGGDEFVVVLDEGSNIEAYSERVRRGVADHPWHSLRPGLQVTVTVGGVQGGPRSMSRADAALLAAKNARKDRSGRPATALTVTR